MTFILNDIKRNDLIKGLEVLGTEKKWFLYFYRLNDLRLFSISHLIEDDLRIIGMGYLYKIASKKDYSFFINPNYRQRGYGKKFVKELIKTNCNVQFSVSEHNTGALKFFRTIEELNVQIKNTKSKTVVFRKFL
jgi:predicted acetyltransferase